jgi:hypothetical protein
VVDFVDLGVRHPQHIAGGAVPVDVGERLAELRPRRGGDEVAGDG